MAFCTNCGNQTDAAFCSKCGKPMGAPAPSFQSAPAPAPPAPAAPLPGAAKRKTSPLIWILAAVAGIFALVAIVAVGAGLFLAHKVKSTGVNSAMMEKDPALAAAMVMTSLNPNVELVKVDEGRGLLTIRDKKTGKTITMNSEDIKNGKLSFSDESTGDKVTFGADSAASLPAWLPAYPGSKPEGTFSASGSGNDGGMAHFKTNDAGSKVLAYYQDTLKSAGFKITSTISGDSGNSKGGVVTAEDAGNRRTVMVTVSSSGEDGTDVTLTYGTKK